MKLLDGKFVSECMLGRLSVEIRELGFQPGLGVILIGNDPASHLYVRLKELAAKRVGIHIEKRLFSEHTAKQEVEAAIRSLNEERRIQGILIQLPLPQHLPTDDIIALLDPMKDVDGFHPENEARISRGEEMFPPVFPRAILELVRSSKVPIAGKKAVVVGNSTRFGDSLRGLLEREGVRASFISGGDIELPQNLGELKRADIVISACGKPSMIVGRMLLPGAIVIDGGIAKIGNRVVGDVDRRSVEEMEGFLSPVPGGVGPVTIACLLANVVQAAKRQRGE